MLKRIKEKYNPNFDLPTIEQPAVPWYTMALVNIIDNQAFQIECLQDQVSNFASEIEALTAMVANLAQKEGR